MDMSKQLQAYEVEYHVLQDELLDTPPTLNQHQRAAQLERTNQSLRQQNLDLLEELQVHANTHIHASHINTSYLGLHSTSVISHQVSHARVCNLESHIEGLVQSENQLRAQVSALEEEKKQLLSTVTRLQDLLSSLGLHMSPDGHAPPPPTAKHTATGENREELGNRTADPLLPPSAPKGS